MTLGAAAPYSPPPRIAGSADRPIVLVDRSLDMLGRAAQRLDLSGHDAARIVLVQADLFDLPFLSRSFPTVACFGLLHLFEDLAATLESLQVQLTPGGSFYATSLVAETAIGRRALALLHHTGEAATPRRESDLAAAALSVLGDTISVRRAGSMAFLTGQPRSAD